MIYFIKIVVAREISTLKDRQTKEKLVESAWAVRENSYSPYSNFKVGAAVLGEDGRVYVGTNVENVSYGGTVCAERCALFGMVAAGCKKFTALCVALDLDGDGAPCLLCRQVMSELCVSLDVPVFYATRKQVYEHTMGEIAPLPVMPNSLFEGQE